MKRLILFVFIFFSTNVLCQEKTDTIQLKDVVYSGQVSAQNIDRSVYEVTVINAEQIKQSAALNLADLLNQTLNIQIEPNPSTGKSGLNMLGFDSEYVKVLIDNVPVINDEGLGNFTDFTQINLSDIQQIEIVEGAMGVEYGADAVAGVINIITDKRASKKLKAKVFVQEETIGGEYNLNTEGRHIKGIDVRKKLGDKVSAGISYNQNIFNGFYNGRKGQKHPKNDGLRGHDWLPKQQHNGNAFARVKLNGTTLSYKFNYFREDIQRYSPNVDENYLVEFDLYDPFPIDKDTEFNTERWYHLLSANGNAWKDAKFNVSLSYQKQDRDAKLYGYKILQDLEYDVYNITYESRKALYGKGLLETVFSPNWSMQFGVEANSIKGKQAPIARIADSSTETIERELGSYDVFASSDIHVGEKVAVRPGIRALFSSRFGTKLAYSISSSYFFAEDWELRAIYGKTPKNPSYEELFTYFVNINHNIRGNENLKPEDGQSVALHLKKNTKIKDGVMLNTKFSASYVEVKDKIGLLDISLDPLQSVFINFRSYSSRGVSLSNSLRAKKLTTSLGLSYRGTGYDSDGRDILYAWQGNFLVNYKFQKLRLNLSSNFKFNGPQYQWVLRNEEIIKGKLNSYSIWDVFARKQFLENWEVIAGVRNLADITQVNTTASADGAHSNGSRYRTLGYGRSYFLKLTYNIPF